MGLKAKWKARAEAKRAERGVLRVSTNSLHGKLYHFWYNHSQFKNKSTYRENLCHYMRVVFFWAPISLFLHLHPKKAPWLRPATIVGAIAVLGWLSWAVYNFPGDSLRVFLITLAMLAIIVGIFFGIVKIDEHKYDIQAWWRNDGRGTALLKFPGRVLGATAYGIYRFFAFKIIRVPLIIWLVAAAWIAGVVIETQVAVVTGILIAGTIALGVIGLAGAVLIEKISEWWRYRDRVKRVSPKKVKDEGIFSIGARYAVAKKGKICPFIEVSG